MNNGTTSPAAIRERTALRDLRVGAPCPPCQKKRPPARALRVFAALAGLFTLSARAQIPNDSAGPNNSSPAPAPAALNIRSAPEKLSDTRRETSLNHGWRSLAADTVEAGPVGFEQPGFDDSAWTRVDVPHNWDDYGGLTRVLHGNRHGSAWYRRGFTVPASESGRRVTLFFEGVGSYATVWVNGKLAGTHAGGRTTFTLDVTDLVEVGGDNLLAVRADHPAGISDLPWVCGGCHPMPGFSEGSQPMGIFRPVTLVTTEQIHVEPFGVHVWNEADATATEATIRFTVELKNHGAPRPLVVETKIFDARGLMVSMQASFGERPGGVSRVSDSVSLLDAKLWSVESPYLYRMETILREAVDADGRASWTDGRVLDRVATTFGVRTLRWPTPGDPEGGPFYLNGEPLFINGTCEYEHLLGGSHAFGPEQIAARVAQVKATGYNAFRDAHQPHNLRYQDHWDREGILWWPQMAAQIWFDTPEFRANFKQLLREWVRERRNNPSNILWGLANESKLPEDFARECVEIIRELDPTASTQRLVTTCNAGTGTDWNVPQNWTGTYGGDPATYAEDLKRQQLIGEYGAWRSLGLHSEGGYIADGVRSEDRADAIYATKIRLAESVRDQVPGHFHWLLATHENPGRSIASKGQQGTDGWAELDRIGPANNKGLLTLWGEPTDAFYLYRASYVPVAREPMVHIVSHTWPDRWREPGLKDGLLVYSNCEEVELFNDAGGRVSLGVRRKGGPGVPFRWDGVEIRHNVLHGEGRVGGRVVARDSIVLKNLPPAPHVAELRGEVRDLTAPAPGWNYLYRVNCGGPDHTDAHGALWQADRDFAPGLNHGTLSWAMDYPELPARLGSQRESFEVVRGTDEQVLYQTYRYGRNKLSHRFAVPDGDYRVELHFMEPWYGAGGGDCAGWRLFDVAINGTTVLRDVDLWREAGFATAIKKVVNASVRGGWLEISYPRVASYQAVISAIAVASADPAARVPAEDPKALRVAEKSIPLAAASGDAVGGATAYPLSAARREGRRLVWTVSLGLGGAHDFSVRYANPGPEPLEAALTVTAADGTPMGSGRFALELSAGAVATLADLGMNAGDYTVVLELPEKGSPDIQSLIVK